MKPLKLDQAGFEAGFEGREISGGHGGGYCEKWSALLPPALSMHSKCQYKQRNSAVLEAGSVFRMSALDLIMSA